jgi:photosystem II stability/assembly factor-like uncharacterized protein
MKNFQFLLIILFFTFAPQFIFSQGWFISHTFNPSQSLQTIEFFDENTGYTTAPVYTGGSMLQIHKTTNAGLTWVSQNAGYTGTRFMAIHIIHPDTVYVSGNEGLILKTVNGGTNWVTINTEASLQLWGLFFVNSLTGYTCGSGGRIMKTTNAGFSWFNLVSPTMTSLSSIHFINENTGFISGHAIALKTTNAGTNWINMNAPFISGFENFREIFFFNENLGLYVSDAGRIVKTTNSGAVWNLMESGTTQSLFGVKFIDNMTGYACGNGGAIVRTTNGGDNWSTQVSPLIEILTDVWFTNASTGFISTWSGKVLKTTNGGITSFSQIGTEVPESFKLEQNYPNPFNPKTKINFHMPRSGFVKLTVFNVIGKEIELLVNEEVNAGTFEVLWDASNHPSGVYFYALKTKDFYETKKMILIK